MNSCVLMAKIIRSPELRYTKDNQLAITEMMVEFESLSPNSPPSNLKVIGWGNLATEIEQKYREGDTVILAGRLKMDTIERQEGFKEKRAELTVSSIEGIDSTSKNTNSSSENIVKMDSYKSSSSTSEINKSEDELTPIKEDEISENPPSESSNSEENNLDHIPF